MIYSQSFIPPPQLTIIGYEESQLMEQQKNSERYRHSNGCEKRIPWEKPYTQFHDIFFTMLYLVVSIGVFVFGCINAHQVWLKYSLSDGLFDYFSEPLQINDIDIPNMIVLFGVIATQTLMFCFILLLLMFFLCRMFVLIGLFANLVIGIWTTVWCFQMGGIPFAVGGLLLTCLVMWAFWGLRSKINFSVQVLKVIASVMHQHPSVWMVFLLGMLSSWCFTIFYLTASVFTYIIWSNEQNTGVKVCVTLLWIFSGFYTTEVNRGVLNVCVSSIFAKWYYKSELGTFRVVSTILSKCFGSICFGSLLVSITQLLKECLRVMQSDTSSRSNLLGMFFMFLIRGGLEFLEWLMKYFNEYSFSYMSIHCTGYLKSSRGIYKLFKSKGLDALANDCIINTSLKSYLLIISLSAGLTTYFYFQFMQPHYKSDTKYILTLVVITCIMALQIGRSLLNVINAGAHTLFICLTENPEVFLYNHPINYNKLKNPLEKFHSLNVV